ncbi:MAG TPA: hypothetical protein VFB43_18330 [Terracidiphilus sp.]|nr:hypothetical protein [Terracidiphilus sp.]
MKKRSLWISAAAAVAVAGALAGCGKTSYFDGRVLPPSGLVNRVLIAVQNPGALSKGALEIVDAYYDIRQGYNGSPASFSVSGFGGALPVTIQNMPEEQTGAVYGAGDGSFTLTNYQSEKTTGTVSGLSGPSSSIFVTRNLQYVVAASQAAHVLTIVNQANSTAVALSLPGIYRVSVNPGGSMALAFVQNSNYAYFPIQLTTAQSLAYSGGPTTWPKAAVDCEPQNGPIWCLFQAQSPDHLDSTGNYYGAPLTFDRPVKALFSQDGSTAYVLSCGPECGGTASSVSLLPVSPLIFLVNKNSGLLPCNLPAVAACPNANAKPMVNIPIPGGASNALIDTSSSNRMFVVGQSAQTINGQTLFGGNLTQVNLSNNTAGSPVAISDGQPGAMSRMIEADDNTLWIAMTGCTVGVRYATNPASGYGCLTMYNTSTNKVVLLEPYIGNATGIAAVAGLHKIYAAEGGQVYIYSTKDGSSIDNQYVTVTGTAYDVAYMDSVTDTNNTVY